MEDFNAPRICVDCGKEFFIGEGLKKKLAENSDWVAPKRCFECGKKKKQQRNSPFGKVSREFEPKEPYGQEPHY